jgi:hypothetical protein
VVHLFRFLEAGRLGLMGYRVSVAGKGRDEVLLLLQPIYFLQRGWDEELPALMRLTRQDLFGKPGAQHAAKKQ